MTRCAARLDPFLFGLTCFFFYKKTINRFVKDYYEVLIFNFFLTRSIAFLKVILANVFLCNPFNGVFFLFIFYLITIVVFLYILFDFFCLFFKKKVITFFFF